MYYFESELAPLNDIPLRYDIWEQLPSGGEAAETNLVAEHYLDIASELFGAY